LWSINGACGLLTPGSRDVLEEINICTLDFFQLGYVEQKKINTFKLICFQTQKITETKVCKIKNETTPAPTIILFKPRDKCY